MIRTAVIEGIATATEVSTIGIVYAADRRAGLIYRQFDWRRLYPMLVETAALSGAILLIIGTATGMAWALTQSGFSRQLAPGDGGDARRRGRVHGGVDRGLRRAGQRAGGHSRDRAVRPAAVSVARAIGINEVHYAMVVILAMGIGLFAPPFGVGYYAACAIGRVSPDAAMRRIWPYLLARACGPDRGRGGAVAQHRLPVTVATRFIAATALFPQSPASPLHPRRAEPSCARARHAPPAATLPIDP